MNNPTLVVGDIHGKTAAVNAALATEYPVVFLGDYLDSFSRSDEDHIYCLRTVVDAMDEGRAIALKGNHELSYMGYRCSGFRKSLDKLLVHMKPYLEKLQDYAYVEGFLLSHAGVSQRLLTALGQTLDEYLEEGRFMDVGRTRGGPAPAGGLFWCDWRDEFVPLDDTPQIVGHTHSTMIRQKGNSYCIDCIPYEVRTKGYGEYNALLIEGGEAQPYKLL